MFTKTIAAAILSAFLFSCNQSGGGSSGAKGGIDPSEFSGRPGDCKEFIASLPSTYFHDWLSVPENPFDPSGLQINVFYYGPNQLDKDLVLFYNGGPGSDSHGTMGHLEPGLTENNLQSRLSFVYMDQRGTGCSSAYPSARTDADILRSRWYGSTGIVYDSEALRTKLIGQRKWKVFGQSYGAFIVHRYAALFPTSLEAGYAHANTLNEDPELRLYNRIFSQYRVVNLFLEKYPEDRAKLLTLKTFLSPQKCFQTQFVGNVCGHEVIEGLVSYVGFSNRWEQLHKRINLMVPGLAPNLMTSEEAIKSFVSAVIDVEEAPTGFALSVISYYDRNVSTGDYTSCGPIYTKLAAQGITEDQLLINECMLSIQTKRISTSSQRIRTVLNNTHDHLTLEKLKAGLVQMNAKSFFLYSGEKDAFVPKESFPEEVSYLGDLINYTHFMNSGHEGYRTEKQVWGDLGKAFN